MKLVRFLLVVAVACAAGLAVIVFTSARAGAAEHADAPAGTWPHVTGHWPSVVVDVHTSERWFPARAAVKAWDSGLRVGTCHRGDLCVTVVGATLGTSGEVSYTSYDAVDQSGHFTRVTVTFNRSYRFLSLAARAEAATHELGHALGLGHDWGGGVMYPIADGHHQRISGFERGELHRMYFEPPPPPSEAPTLHL